MIFATGNRHKLRELRALLPGVELEPLPEGVTLPPEDGESFAEIALDKARAAHRATGEAAVADDSGIGAIGLDGRPGIHSARYGGEGASDEENLAKLLRRGRGGRRRSPRLLHLRPRPDRRGRHRARLRGALGRGA